MKTRTWSSTSRPAAELAEALRTLGFTSAAGGEYEHMREGFRLSPGHTWWTLRRPVVSEGLQACEKLLVPSGEPGLWKRVRVDNHIERVFTLPASLLAPDSLEQEIEEETLIRQTLEWALETARGRVPDGWTAPERRQLERWFAPEQLTVVSGALLRQGELISEPARLALRFPIVPELPPDLPDARRGWLRVLLEEAQNRWHIIRCGWLESAEGLTATLEVDLTGAPEALQEDLFVTSLEAVRWTVQWLGEPADWLADVTVASELLAVRPNEEPTKGAP